MKQSPIRDQSHIIDTPLRGATSVHDKRRTVKIHPNQGFIRSGTLLSKVNGVYVRASYDETLPIAGIVALGVDTGEALPIASPDDVSVGNVNNIRGVVDIGNITVNATHLTLMGDDEPLTAEQAGRLYYGLVGIGIDTKNVDDIVPLGESLPDPVSAVSSSIFDVVIGNFSYSGNNTGSYSILDGVVSGSDAVVREVPAYFGSPVFSVSKADYNSAQLVTSTTANASRLMIRVWRFDGTYYNQALTMFNDPASTLMPILPFNGAENDLLLQIASYNNNQFYIPPFEISFQPI